MDVRGLRITVVGMAKSGVALCRLLTSQGARVLACDTKPLSELIGVRDELEALGVKFVEQGPAALENCDVAALSPGVPPDLSLLDEARKRGIKITGDVELAGQFLRGPVMGITGSNGKTTVTALCGHLLRESGIACQVGGNIGTPVASMVESSQDIQWNVLELSSFQLEMVEHFRVRIAVALNVTPDHLDRHHTFENYAAAKARIFRNQTGEDFAVLNRENETTCGYAGLTKGAVYWFDAGAAVEQGFGREGDELLASGRPFMPSNEVPLRGRHNIENVLAAACACRLAGAELDALRVAVKSFPGVEHRIEFVRTVNGVAYYNDSKATNVDSVIKALESFEGGLWVILGGKDKQSDYRPLVSLLRDRAKGVLLIGAATEVISNQIGKDVRLLQCGDLPTAVQYAAAHAGTGDAVLLSPACASFDQFTSYEHRGRVFKRLVTELNERKPG